MSITSTVLAIFASRCGDKTRKSQKARDVFPSLSLSCRTKHPVLSRAADAQGKGVQCNCKVLESVISSDVWRTKRTPTKAPWTSSLEVELVGQDNQNVDVDIPFVATLESLALHNERERKIDGRGGMTLCS